MTSAAAVKQMTLGPMANFVYLIGSPDTGEAAVVDPAWNAEAILQGLERERLRLVALFATHHHFDHVNALVDLQGRTGAPAFVNEREVPYFNRIGANVTGVGDGQEISVGDVAVTCLHTPGHTPGSQCLLVAGRLISGDTLFIGSCGRCDLPDSSPADLYASLCRLRELPPETILLPGHNYGDRPTSTIEHESRTNPFLKISDLQAFLHVMGV